MDRVTHYWHSYLCKADDTNHPIKICKHYITRKRSVAAICIIAAMLSFAGCSQQSKDKEIKADITTKTKTDVNFAGVSYTVNNGIVTLTGNCPTAKSKSDAEATIKGINIIKGINNQIQIAPVELTADFTLKQSVDSVLAAYPAVKADVAQQVVTLTGQTKKQEVNKLIPAIDKLNPMKVENQLTIQ